MNSKQVLQPEFSYGGIDAVIEKEFIAKLIGLSNLNDDEMFALTQCVIGDEYKSQVAREIGVPPARVGQIINKALRKLRHTFEENGTQLDGKHRNVIRYESTNSFQERVSREKKKEVKERVVIDSHGATHWYRGNLLHREDAPAIVQANGGQAWFHYGNRHREDGPAIEYADGSKEWWLHGQRHRQIGYAVEHANGKHEKWLYNNKIYEETTPVTVFK